MARSKGSAKFSGNLEVAAGGALDARSVAPTKADLTVAANYPYSYVGMLVSVQDEGKLYMLTAKPTTTLSNWKEVGSDAGGGSENIVEGYFNPSDNLFYEESTYTTAIAGEENVLYISVDTNKSYRFASTIFVRIDEEDGKVYVVEGYRNSSDGLFYREAAFTNVITGATGVIYVALNENATYRYAGNAFTRLDKENPELVFGYYKDADGLMYEEAAFTNTITGDTSKMYVALNTDKTFRYSGTAFVQLDKEEFENIQVSFLPTASSTVVGKIYQYIGTTDANYTNAYFYKCIEDPENAGSYIWVQTNTQPEGSGSGDAKLTADVKSNLAVGAIASGTTIAKDTTFTEFVQKLLITEIAPTVTFSATGAGVKEVGTSVTPTLTLTISSNGTGTPTAIKFYSGTTLLNTKTYVSGTTSYSYTMSSAITDTTTVKGVLEYKKSDDSTANITKTSDYTFVMASYYGAVTSAPTTKAGITALTKNVKNTKAQTATFNLNNQKSCYCYPASFGNLSSIKDANNFEYLSSYTKTTVEVDGTNYNVYTLTDPVTAAGFKQVYA